MAIRFRAFCLLLVLLPVQTAFGQAKDGPQVWWPVQPRPLPFVHSLFTDDMVMQRDIAAPIWGWSTPEDKITVSIDGKQSGQAAEAGKDGKWQTKIGPLPAGGPHTITVAGAKQSATLKNVLFGDVWLCSGQSNMNWPVRLTLNAEKEIKEANYPEIRSFTVSHFPSLVPMKLPPPARWEVCTPEFAKNFTGVGYYFAREIHQTQKIPIGIIHSSVGATFAEAWCSREELRKYMNFDFYRELAEATKAGASNDAGKYDYFAEVEKWTATIDPESARKKYASDPELKTDDWLDMAVPKPWEEAGLPDFDGLVWFRHWIDVPKEWSGQDLRLQLATINDVDIAWFNGTLIGCTQIKESHRNYIVDGKLVKPGKNLLAFAVNNREGPGGFCSTANSLVVRPVTGNDKPLSLAGTWKAKKSAANKDINLPFPRPKVSDYRMITGCYNGMIAPLTPFGIKGVVWYQGESNQLRWLQYRRLLPTLIADWRKHFEVSDLPFLIVSIANCNARQTMPVEPGWAELRESQWRTVRKVPNTGLAMAVETNEGTDIHPRNKQEVGRRVALTARHLVYGAKLDYSGPEFTEMQIEPQKARIRLYFKHVGGGLTIKRGENKLTGFAIAGADKNFVWADAEIDGGTILVSSPDVADPKYVRYGWATNPLVNLYNKEGLPAITFRTDE